MLKKGINKINKKNTNLIDLDKIFVVIAESLWDSYRFESKCFFN